MKLNWNFQRGGEVLIKIPFGGEVWIFYGTTHCRYGPDGPLGMDCTSSSINEGPKPSMSVMLFIFAGY